MAVDQETILPGTPDSQTAMSKAHSVSSMSEEEVRGESVAEKPAEKEAQLENTEEVYADVTYLDIFKQFVLMGWIAFGGPAAHIGLFQKRFVEKLHWMSNSVFMEIFALGQCLPGPTSTQVSFAIGIIKKGVWGGLMSGALFQYPGAIIMTAVGAGAANWLVDPPGWLDGATAGLSAVGVALVASACKGMMFKLCDTMVTGIICVIVAAIAIYYQFAWIYPCLIAAGGIVTIIQKWKDDCALKEKDNSVRSVGLNMWAGGLLIAAWLSVLITIIVIVNDGSYSYDSPEPIQWFEVFFEVGSIIYGGGQVVLPLLSSYVVRRDCSVSPCLETGWVTSQQFYAGLGVVQGLPGPLFNFSAYLGAIIAKNYGYNFMLGAVLAWFGLFGPGVSLIFGFLPFWTWLRKFQYYRRALPGLNAAGVGLILASVFSMTTSVYSISPFPTYSLVIGLLAYGSVDLLKLFEPAVVLGGAVLGIIGWALNAS